jgi:hypothetical protein
VQAGLEYERPNAHAISTALGYNQLLNTNSVELMAEHGDKFLALLKTKSASLSGEDRAALEAKIEVVRSMIGYARSVPDDWNQHEQIANTPQGLGIHAMNLDVDVGPLLQTQKLNGFDMISLPQDRREQVPTSNFFQRRGFERNPVAIRNNTAAKLLAATDAKMDVETTLQGAKDLAAAF